MPGGQTLLAVARCLGSCGDGVLRSDLCVTDGKDAPSSDDTIYNKLRCAVRRAIWKCHRIDDGMPDRRGSSLLLHVCPDSRGSWNDRVE